MYLEFQVHYNNELNDIKREIESWAHKQGIRYTQKTIKYTHRVGFDRDSDFTLFAMTWQPDLETRPYLAYQIIRVQNEKYWFAQNGCLIHNMLLLCLLLSNK